jgi:hypothetical protein
LGRTYEAMPVLLTISCVQVDRIAGAVDHRQKNPNC